MKTVTIIQKIIFSLLLLSVFGPFIFTDVKVFHYHTMPDYVSYSPKTFTFYIIATLVVLMILSVAWEKELATLFKNKNNKKISPDF